MIPAELPDEWLRQQLEEAPIAALFPVSAVRLVYIAAEYTHRIGLVHPHTPYIARCAPHGPPYVLVTDAQDELIERWRTDGVTWTRRTPPRWIPPAQIVYAPAVGTRYRRDHYKYRVHRHTPTECILVDEMNACAYVTPSYDKLEHAYEPVGKVHRVYRFGGTTLFPSSPATPR